MSAALSRFRSHSRLSALGSATRFGLPTGPGFRHHLGCLQYGQFFGCSVRPFHSYPHLTQWQSIREPYYTGPVFLSIREPYLFYLGPLYFFSATHRGQRGSSAHSPPVAVRWSSPVQVSPSRVARRPLPSAMAHGSSYQGAAPRPKGAITLDSHTWQKDYCRPGIKEIQVITLDSHSSMGFHRNAAEEERKKR